MNKFIKVAAFAAAALCMSGAALAEETTTEKMGTAVNETVDGVKSGARAAKDKACEMINGKLECAGKRIKSKAKNLGDKVETKAKEMKNKID